MACPWPEAVIFTFFSALMKDYLFPSVFLLEQEVPGRSDGRPLLTVEHRCTNVPLELKQTVVSLFKTSLFIRKQKPVSTTFYVLSLKVILWPYFILTVKTGSRVVNMFDFTSGGLPAPLFLLLLRLR